MRNQGSLSSVVGGVDAARISVSPSNILCILFNVTYDIYVAILMN